MVMLIWLVILVDRPKIEKKFDLLLDRHIVDNIYQCYYLFLVIEIKKIQSWIACDESYK